MSSFPPIVSIALVCVGVVFFSLDGFIRHKARKARRAHLAELARVARQQQAWENARVIRGSPDGSMVSVGDETVFVPPGNENDRLLERITARMCEPENEAADKIMSDRIVGGMSMRARLARQPSQENES